MQDRMLSIPFPPVNSYKLAVDYITATFHQKRLARKLCKRKKILDDEGWLVWAGGGNKGSGRDSAWFRHWEGEMRGRIYVGGN
jgi:hypothetical protein